MLPENEDFGLEYPPAASCGANSFIIVAHAVLQAVLVPAFGVLNSTLLRFGEIRRSMGLQFRSAIYFFLFRKFRYQASHPSQPRLVVRACLPIPGDRSPCRFELCMVSA